MYVLACRPAIDCTVMRFTLSPQTQHADCTAARFALCLQCIRQQAGGAVKATGSRSAEVAEQPGNSAQWLALFERNWGQKLDEVIILSRACRGSPASGEDTDDQHVRVPNRLWARLARAHEELTEIGTVIDKLAVDKP